MLTKSETKLSKMLGTDFQRSLLAASVKSLGDAANPLALNNFSASFRELVRHVLSHLAPDKEIKACPWYKPEKTSKSGITRAHAITYLVQGGLADDYVIKTLKLDVATEKKKLVAAINELNKFTHVEEKTFGIDAKAAGKVAEQALQALTDVLLVAKACREQLAECLEEHISERVVSEAIGDTIGEIDLIASHHSIEEVMVEEIKVTGVTSDSIHITASGSIDAEMQWGSNSDVRHGDGVVFPLSFPFTCDLRSSVESPDELEIDEKAICVDTSSWWDGYYDET